MLLLIGILSGVLLPIQTSMNSKFRFKVGSPYLATINSLIGGMLFLMIISLITDHPLFIPLSFLTSHPWWMELGGIMGPLAFTINILLLPKLGAVQTVIMPLLGQTIMSMLIDEFGWFRMPIATFNFIRLIGVIALLVGVLLVVYQKQTRKTNHGDHLPWQILGIIAGFALAIQTASNGALGKAFTAPVTAGVFSLMSGAILMIVIIGIFKKNLTHIFRGFGHGNRWWICLGGPVGSLYLFGSLALAPIIGAGTAIILTILGNIIGSIFIDKYGLLGTAKRHVGIRQYSGLLIMIIGVVLIKMF